MKRKLSQSHKASKKITSETLKVTGRRTSSKGRDSKRKTNGLTNQSRDSHKGAKKLMGNWIERQGDEEETKDETDDEDESQTEEEDEEFKDDGEEVSEDEIEVEENDGGHDEVAED